MKPGALKPHRPQSLEELLPLIRALQEQVRREHRAEIVGIFGSYARNKVHKGSDLDLLVRFHEGASLFDLVALALFLEEKLGLRVDLVSERALRPEIRDQILAEVVRV